MLPTASPCCGAMMAGIAPTLWRAASGVSRVDLVRAAIAAHGHPTGAEPAVLVDAALVELAAEGDGRERRPGRGEAPEPAAGAPRWRIGGDVAWHDSGDRVVVLPLAEVEAPTRQNSGHCTSSEDAGGSTRLGARSTALLTSRQRRGDGAEVTSTSLV